MQQIQPGNRPDLKGRRVARNRRKVTVMQPFPHLRFTRNTGKSEIIVGPACSSVLLGCGKLVVFLDEAGTDEEDVSDTDVATLGFGA